MTKAAAMYGESFYGLAAAEDLTDEILAEMNEISKIFRENPDYIRLLCEPSVAKRERLGLIEQAFGGQITQYHLNFLMILCEKGLMREYIRCARAFERCYNRDHGILEAVVTSAVALSREQAAALKDRLEQREGKKIRLTERVDPRILGGLRVEVDGRLLDGTIENRLNAIKRSILCN